ncbi:MAG: peptidylprolyl isomerase [Gemmatimonadaceae bacterium]
MIPTHHVAVQRVSSGARARVFAMAGALVVALAGACHRPSPLLAPQPPGLDATSPDSFVVRFETTRGDVDLAVHRDWAPLGADRLYWLVTHGYYDGARFFRVVPGFVAQFGIPAEPEVTRQWRQRRIADDSVTRSNVRGTLSFATSGPNTRTAQLFINLVDNSRLDSRGFAVLAQVVAGMAVVDSLHGGYGEAPPRGTGPQQDRITSEGDRYLQQDFPRLDQIRSTRVIRRYKR